MPDGPGRKIIFTSCMKFSICGLDDGEGQEGGGLEKGHSIACIIFTGEGFLKWVAPMKEESLHGKDIPGQR